MHLRDIKIIDSFVISKRGMTLVTELDYDMENHRFNTGDTLRYEDRIFEITSVQAILKKTDGKFRDYVAFIVKEITVKELLNKNARQKKTVWIKKNRWWLRIWQFIKLKFEKK